MIVYLSCLLAGGVILWAYSTIWLGIADEGMGRFWTNIGQALVSAGILGFAYELFVRQASAADGDLALNALEAAFATELANSDKMLLEEIARTPLRLDESVRLLAMDRRLEVAKLVFRDMAGSNEIAEALLKSAVNMVGDDGDFWRDTTHIVTFLEEDQLRSEGLIRVIDRVSYETTIRKTTFRAALLRDLDVMSTIRERGDIDAFWVSSRGFITQDEKHSRRLAFEDFSVIVGGATHTPIPVITELTDGSVYCEYSLPEPLVGEEARIKYTFHIVADAKGPYFHVAVPKPSIGFRVVVQNKVDQFSRVEARLFVPDPSVMVREQIGSETTELRTSQVVLKGHGAVVMLR